MMYALHFVVLFAFWYHTTSQVTVCTDGVRNDPIRVA